MIRVHVEAESNLRSVVEDNRKIEQVGQCMVERLKLPIGIENFAEVRKSGFYFVDKTKLIEELLTQWGAGESLYASAAFWKNTEHEYAAVFFRDWHGQVIV